MQRIESRMRWLVFVMVLSVAVMMSACATMQTNPLLSDQAKAEKQLAEWQKTYGAVFVQTKAVLENPASSKTDKDICNKQLAVMKVVWPLLQEYESYVKAGRSVAGLDVDRIIKLMTQLQGGG